MALVQYSSTNFVDYQVGLTLGIGIGYRISGNAIRAPRPSTQILKNLNGDVFPWNSSATNIGLLAASIPTPFQTIPEKLVSLETVTLINQGSIPLIVQEPYFTNFMTTAQAVYTGTGYTSPPWTINTGSSVSFGLRYISSDVGSFYESIIFNTNEAESIKKYNITVNSNYYYVLDVDPGGFDIETELPGENFVGTYTITAVVDGIPNSSLEIPFTADISGSDSWSIDSTGFNQVTVRYNAWQNNNSTGTFISLLSISAPGVAAQTFANTATQNIDFSLNYNSSTWISALTLPDAIVGLRMDYVQIKGTSSTVRTLTMGVGSGADLSPPLSEGVESWFTEANLSPAAGRGKYPFAFWQTVCQIPLPSTSTFTTYYSGDYRVKSQEPLSKDYDWYFGHYASEGSMFIIEQDSLGYVYIRFNDLREYSTSTAVNQTLDRISRSFYYYSDIDTAYRTNGQLDPSPRDEFGVLSASGLDTRLLIGFDRQNQPLLSLVRLPT